MLSTSDILAAHLMGRDLPKDEPKVKVRVTTIADRQVVAGVTVMPEEKAPRRPISANVTARTTIVEVYESEVAELEALIDPAFTSAKDELALAEKHFAADLESWTERLIGNRERTPELVKEAAATFAGSVYGAFRRMNRRDLKPFVSVERVTEDPKDKKKAA